MRKISLAIAVLAMLFTAGMANAGDVFIDGYVYDQFGDPVPGATLRWGFITGYVYVQSDSNGYYWVVSDRNWCGTKNVRVSRTGYLTKNYSVRDDTCCECIEGCVPPDPEHVCAGWLRKSFHNLFGFDSDNDGILDGSDNCPYVPNGPDKGTCSSGTDKGSTCYSQSQCRGCTGFCSMNQEDGDGDGIGDVCDSTPFQATSLKAPSFYLSCAVDENFREAFPYLCNPEMAAEAPAEALTQEKLLAAAPNRVSADLALVVMGLLPQLYCWSQGGCNYNCIEQAIADFLNGPDAFIWWIYPDGKQELPECPERLRMDDWINDFLKALFVIFFGDNFPEGELPWENGAEE